MSKCTLKTSECQSCTLPFDAAEHTPAVSSPSPPSGCGTVAGWLTSLPLSPYTCSSSKVSPKRGRKEGREKGRRGEGEGRERGGRGEGEGRERGGRGEGEGRERGGRGEGEGRERGGRGEGEGRERGGRGEREGKKKRRR